MSELTPETVEAPDKPAEAPDAAPIEQPDEPDEPDKAAEDEPQDEPQSSAASPEEWERRLGKSEQRFATYERAIFGIFEDDAHDLLPCPLCFGPVRGFVDRNSAGRIPDEQADLVKHFLGITREVEYPHGSQYRTCPECDGLGKVTTGSRVPGNETVGCGACHERGWIGPAAAVGNGHRDEAPALTGPTAPESWGANDDMDEWKEPRILPDGRQNPNFGKMPNRKIQVAPWGTTAGLTAQDAVSA